MEFVETDFKKDVQTKFENLLEKKFSYLQPVEKWKQTMWHKDGELVVSLIFSKEKLKFCFFNNPNTKLDKHQRWSTTIFSENLEIENQKEIDWEVIEKLIRNEEKIKY